MVYFFNSDIFTRKCVSLNGWGLSRFIQHGRSINTTAEEEVGKPVRTTHQEPFNRGQEHPGQGEPSNGDSCSWASGCVLLFVMSELRRKIRILGLNIAGEQEPGWSQTRVSMLGESCCTWEGTRV